MRGRWPGSPRAAFALPLVGILACSGVAAERAAHRRALQSLPAQFGYVQVRSARDSSFLKQRCSFWRSFWATLTLPRHYPFDGLVRNHAFTVHYRAAMMVFFDWQSSACANLFPRACARLRRIRNQQLLPRRGLGLQGHSGFFVTERCCFSCSGSVADARRFDFD